MRGGGGGIGGENFFLTFIFNGCSDPNTLHVFLFSLLVPRGEENVVFAGIFRGVWAR